MARFYSVSSPEQTVVLEELSDAYSSYALVETGGLIVAQNTQQHIVQSGVEIDATIVYQTPFPSTQGQQVFFTTGNFAGMPQVAIQGGGRSLLIDQPQVLLQNAAQEGQLVQQGAIEAVQTYESSELGPPDSVVIEEKCVAIPSEELVQLANGKSIPLSAYRQLRALVDQKQAYLKKVAARNTVEMAKSSSKKQQSIYLQPSKKPGDGSSRMYIYLEGGEQRLVTFQLPEEKCAVQELLDVLHIPYEGKKIQVQHGGAINLDYIVAIGDIDLANCTPPTSQAEAGSSGDDSSCHSSTPKSQLEELTLPPPIEPPKPPPPALPAGKLALCNHCGFLSNLINMCIRCKRGLPENVKLVDDKPTLIFFKGKDKTNGCYPAKPAGAKTPSSLLSTRTRKLRMDAEPVVLTLSSDDEEAEDRQSAKNLMKTCSTAKLKPVSKEPTMIKGVSEEQAAADKDFSLPEAMSHLNINIVCRMIKVGSYKCKGVLQFSKDSLKIIVSTPKWEKAYETLEIPYCKMLKTLICLNETMPVLFVYALPSIGEIIRDRLGMEKGSDHYYDPLSREDCYKKITLLPDNLGSESKNALKLIIASSRSVFEELGVTDAHTLLIRNCIPEAKKSQNNSFSEVKTLLIYPPGTGGIAINTEDYLCLAQDQFLNDVIIDFYFKYLITDVWDQNLRNKVHIFSSFFYRRLTTKPASSSRRSNSAEFDTNLTVSERRHARVKNWTKNVNIFDKDFIIIPINESCHWFLAIIAFPALDGPVLMQDDKPVSLVEKVKKVKKDKTLTIGNTTISLKKTEKEKPIYCDDDGAGSDRDEAEADESEVDSDGGNSSDSTEEPKADVVTAIKQPCILIFDSLGGASRSRVVATLRDYLTCEYKAKTGKTKIFNRDNIKGACPKVPQQNNFTDCGLYVLQYVEAFFKDPILDYKIPIKQLKNWFEEIEVTKKREDISVLIKDLMSDLDRDHSVLPNIVLPTLNGKLFESENSEKSQDQSTDIKSDLVEAYVASHAPEQAIVRMVKLNTSSQDTTPTSSPEKNRDTLKFLKSKRIIKSKPSPSSSSNSSNSSSNCSSYEPVETKRPKI